jgi:hypothetical protein
MPPLLGTLIPVEVIEAILELKPSPLHHMYRLKQGAIEALADHLTDPTVQSTDYGEKLTFGPANNRQSVYLMIDYDAMIAVGEEWDDPIDADLANEYTVIDNDEFGGEEAVQQEVLQALTLAAHDMENQPMAAPNVADPNAEDDVEMAGGKTRRRKGKTLKGKGKGKKKTTRRRKH